MTRLSKTKSANYSERFVVLAVLALVLSVVPASAQSFVEYSAKFVCGVATAATVPAVEPGTYATTINIHNPHDDIFSRQTSTTFLKKAVLALVEGVPPQQPSPFVTDTLKNDFAEEVDCPTIRKLLGITSTTSFIEGYVVIIVPPTSGPAGPFTNELDVVGVYTNSKGALVVRPAQQVAQTSDVEVCGLCRT